MNIVNCATKLMQLKVINQIFGCALFYLIICYMKLVVQLFYGATIN